MLLLSQSVFGVGLGFAAFHLSRTMRDYKKVDRWESPVERGSLLKLAHEVGLRVTGWFPSLERLCRKKYDQHLRLAGLYPLFEGEAMLGFQILGLFGGIASAYLMFPNGQGSLLGGMLGGLYFAHYYFKRKRMEWQDELSRGFPYALDILALSVEGGMDFTGALRELTHYLDPSPVRSECSMILSDIDIGTTRSDALKRFGARTSVPEIKSVVLGIVQSIEMGSGVAETLKKQTAQLRYSRLMKAEEAAQKAPVKMMIPMVLFILPCVFVVIFAPVIISLIPTLQGLKSMQ